VKRILPTQQRRAREIRNNRGNADGRQIGVESGSEGFQRKKNASPPVT